MIEETGKKIRNKRRFKNGRQHHGMSKTPEYKAWAGMLDRCHCPNNQAYHWYGARGIEVCDEWKSNFRAFYDYIGPKPTPLHSLDRINVNGNYEPGNVRWATPLEQVKNRRSSGLGFTSYQKRAGLTAVYPDRMSLLGLIYCILGAAGEAGELANKAKKILRGDRGFELTAEIRKELISEAGDVCWYLSQIATELGVGFEDLARVNLEKLEDRLARDVIKSAGDRR